MHPHRSQGELGQERALSLQNRQPPGWGFPARQVSAAPETKLRRGWLTAACRATPASRLYSSSPDRRAMPAPARRSSSLPGGVAVSAANGETVAASWGLPPASAEAARDYCIDQIR